MLWGAPEDRSKKQFSCGRGSIKTLRAVEVLCTCSTPSSSRHTGISRVRPPGRACGMWVRWVYACSSYVPNTSRCKADSGGCGVVIVWGVSPGLRTCLENAWLSQNCSERKLWITEAFGNFGNCKKRNVSIFPTTITRKPVILPRCQASALEF